MIKLMALFIFVVSYVKRIDYLSIIILNYNAYKATCKNCISTNVDNLSSAIIAG